MSNKTMYELMDVTEEILSGRPLTENLLNDLAQFIDNYKSMQDILSELQGELKDMAKRNGAENGHREMGDGTLIKALNSSKKVSNQMVKMNRDAQQFIRYFRAAMGSR